MLSGHGLVSTSTGSFEVPLSAQRILNPSMSRNCGSIEVGELVIVNRRPQLDIEDAAAPTVQLFERPGPKSVSAAVYCSGVAVVGTCISIVAMITPRRRVTSRLVDQ